MITKSPFRPAWWLPGPHLQTLWPRFARQRPRTPTRRERLDLPDGDFVDLDWTLGSAGPLVCVFHGLAGSIDSPYAGGILTALHDAGMRAVLLHFRGCSGEPNRLARAYHSGDTGDIRFLVETLRQRGEQGPLGGIGFSLGANALLKYLGEEGERCPLQAAVAVSPPLVLSVGADTLRRGFARVYQRYLLRQLQAAAQAKAHLLPATVDLQKVLQARDFWAFDDAFTAPLHGFRDVHQYYADASSRPWLGRIAVPTLIVNSRDDPFWTPAVLPEPHELGLRVTLELSARGGHVGFVQGDGQSWLDVRLPTWLAATLGPRETATAAP